MTRLDGMHGCVSTLAKETVPIVIRVLVIDLILNVEWKQVFYFDWCSKVQFQLRIVSEETTFEISSCTISGN